MASARDFAAATKVSSCQIVSPLTLFYRSFPSRRAVKKNKVRRLIRLLFIEFITSFSLIANSPYPLLVSATISYLLSLLCLSSSHCFFLSICLLLFIFVSSLFCHCRFHSLPSLFSLFSLFCPMFVLIV